RRRRSRRSVHRSASPASASANSSHAPCASCAWSRPACSCTFGPNSYVAGVEPRFVDIHSHVVPSGDDGVQSLSEGLSLGRDAFEHGTQMLYATPHVGPHVPPFDEERERRIRTAFRELRERVPLELRLGFELTPMPSLLDDDPWRFVLEGTEHVLVEIPFVGSADLFIEVGEWIERGGLPPIVAHPERTEAVLTNPGLVDELAERRWPLQVNATSLLGYHSPDMQREGWRLIDDGLASFVASD